VTSWEAKRESLSLLEQALALSSHVLSRDPSEFRAQLLGRLSPDPAPVGEVVAQARAAGSGPWLRPLTPTLHAPGGALLRTLTGWAGYVELLAVTPEGRRAVSGALHGLLKVWDLETGAQLHDLQRFENAITALAVTPNGEHVVVGAGGGSLKLWDLESGTESVDLPDHIATVRAVAVSPDSERVVSASDSRFAPEEKADSRLIVSELSSGRDVRRLSGYSPEATTVAVTADGQRVLTETDDHVLEVWDPERRRCVHALHGHTSYIRSVALTPDASLAISAGGQAWFEARDGDDEPLEEKCALRVWDLRSGEALAVLRGHTDVVRSVAVTSDGSLAVSGSDDGSVRLWDLGTFEEREVLSGHADSVQAVAVTPDGRRAVSASRDHTLRVWDLGKGAPARATASDSGEIAAIAISPDGSRVASASRDGTLIVLGLTTAQPPRTLRGGDYEMCAVGFAGDGRTAVSGGSGADLRVWDLERGREIASLQGHRKIKALAPTEDGRRVAAIDDTGMLLVWDLERGVLLYQAQLRDDRLVIDDVVAVSPDGSRVISTAGHHDVDVRELESGEVLHTLRGAPPLNGPSACAVSLDASRAVIVAGGDAVVWNLKTAERLCELANRTDFVTAAALSPDGRLAVIAEDDDALSVWDLEERRLVHVLRGHSDHVARVRVTADARLAVSIAEDTQGIRTGVIADNRVKVWDLERGDLLASFTGDHVITPFDVAPDGRTVVAGEKSGQIHVLRLEDLDT
jgi:WD40 repeat protein